MQSFSLYLHIPFCRARCSYCAFNIYTDRLHMVEAYLKALVWELDYLGQGQPIQSIYLGGGTPSLLTPQQLEALLTAIRGAYTLTSEAEITLEANPGTVDTAYLAAIRALGINRLSLGMQSAQAEELRLFARDHEHAETVTCMQQARSVGFDNISLDLIYGAPGQSLASWEASLEAALALEPTHFSLYALQLESGTQLKRQVKYGAITAPDDDLVADMYECAVDRLAAAGFAHYEISSWARGDHRSEHNLGYWQGRPYLGLGAGAHGYANGYRTVNVMRPEVYIERLGEAPKQQPYPLTNATQSHERITQEEAAFEMIMLGLRLLETGLSLTEYETRFGESFMGRYGDIVERLRGQGLLRLDAGQDDMGQDDTGQNDNDTRLYMTRSAWLISNRVLAEFL